MLEAQKQLKNRKRNFADHELDSVIDQTYRGKRVLFGCFSSGFSNEMKQVKQRKVTKAVNAATSEPQILDELKVVWFQVRGLRFISAHSESVFAPGRGEGIPVLPPLDERLYRGPEHQHDPLKNSL